MSARTWRAIALAFAALSGFLLWRGGRAAPPADARCATEPPALHAAGGAGGADERRADPAASDDEATPDRVGVAGFGVRLPAWAFALAPQPGEDLLGYRDRIVPVAQAAVAPHRARVARRRGELASAAGLDGAQLAELDAAVADAAAAIQDRVLTAALGGDLAPSRVRPMTAVVLARDVLDEIARADARFQARLRDDQRAVLAASAFDLAEYLLFATRWEDAVGATD